MVNPKKLMKNFKYYIIKTAKSILPDKRKGRYNKEYYLERFLNVLNDISAWDRLSLLIACNGSSYYHWKSIYNEFQRWSKNNIFQIAYENFIKTHYKDIFKLQNNPEFNLFIDVTKIDNSLGCENVTINNEYMKKNITPISVICDENKIPLSITNVDFNRNENDTRNNPVHDVKSIVKSLDNLIITDFNTDDISLIGDKGYITQEQHTINNRHVNILTPKRRNQAQHTDQSIINKLLKRHKIENLFCSLKKCDRVKTRKDKLYNSYISFFYIFTFKFAFNIFSNKENENNQINR